MTKAEYEQALKHIELENNGLRSLLFNIKKFINNTLDVFREDLADLEDERNKGVLAVLNALVDIYNRHSRFDSITPLKGACKIININDFKKGDGNGNNS